MAQFIFTTRVYYSDTDGEGVVYHTNYLKYMEHARSEWLLTLHQDTCFAVCAAELKFLKPARLLDTLEITCEVIKIGKASLEIQHVVRNAEDNNLIYCQGMIKLACVNHKLQPCAIPNEILQKLQ
jgi:acyl-CoA thioester hydrolase